MSRGSVWTHGLAGDGEVTEVVPSVLRADVQLGDGTATVLTVVPDPASPYPRARAGEVGLRESLVLAEQITEIRTSDTRDRAAKQPIIAIVDLPSQAYGRLEETLGIHQTIACAVDAYYCARMDGHPIVTLVVGTALSGGFLAHGLQANQILALNDPGVVIHAMHKAAAARITLRTTEELDELATTIAPLSYAVGQWATLGLCDQLIDVHNAAEPTTDDIVTVRKALSAAVNRARTGPLDLSNRRQSDAAKKVRKASRKVCQTLAAEW
jgi:biotin-independent malonate decarboxylase gamma subunit